MDKFIDNWQIFGDGHLWKRRLGLCEPGQHDRSTLGPPGLGLFSHERLLCSSWAVQNKTLSGVKNELSQKSVHHKSIGHLKDFDIKKNEL